jgi:hypothetical protein
MNAKTTIRIDEDLLLKARHRCLDEDITFQEMVERALREYLKKPLEKERKAHK